MNKCDEIRGLLKSLTEKDPLGTPGPLAVPIDLAAPPAALVLGKDKKKNFKKIEQSCQFSSFDFQVSNWVKFAQIMDGYLSSYDSNNAVGLYLYSRYLVEQHSFVDYVASRLKKTVSADASDWEGRGRNFFGILSRTRHATKDKLMEENLQGVGVSKKQMKGFHIKDCLNHLEKMHPDLNVMRSYDFLSDRVHHNGASHYLGSPGFYESNESKIWGGTILHSKRLVTRYEYPNTDTGSDAEKTAEIVLNHARKLILLLANGVPLSPYSDAERINHMGKIAVFDQRKKTEVGQKIGRNAPCPCGSEKKYKHCCMNKTIH